MSISNGGRISLVHGVVHEKLAHHRHGILRLSQLYVLPFARSTTVMKGSQHRERAVATSSGICHINRSVAGGVHIGVSA